MKSGYYREDKIVLPLSSAVLSAMRHIIFSDTQKIFSFRLSDSAAAKLYEIAVSTGIFTASAYTAPKKGKIVYNKAIHNKYSKVENTILDSLKNFDDKIDISSLNVPRSDISEIFRLLHLP